MHPTYNIAMAAGQDAGNGWTAGPWRAFAEELRRGTYWCVKPVAGGDYIVDGIHEEDRGEANARLIAAAPDLFEALELLCDRFDTIDGQPFVSPADSPWTKARAALARARGEDQ